MKGGAQTVSNDEVGQVLWSESCEATLPRDASKSNVGPAHAMAAGLYTCCSPVLPTHTRRTFASTPLYGCGRDKGQGRAQPRSRATPDAASGIRSTVECR